MQTAIFALICRKVCVSPWRFRSNGFVDFILSSVFSFRSFAPYVASLMCIKPLNGNGTGFSIIINCYFSFFTRRYRETHNFFVYFFIYFLPPLHSSERACCLRAAPGATRPTPANSSLAISNHAWVCVTKSLTDSATVDLQHNFFFCISFLLLLPSLPHLTVIPSTWRLRLALWMSLAER